MSQNIEPDPILVEALWPSDDVYGLGLTLVQNYKFAGNHSVDFFCTGLSSTRAVSLLCELLADTSGTHRLQTDKPFTLAKVGAQEICAWLRPALTDDPAPVPYQMVLELGEAGWMWDCCPSDISLMDFSVHAGQALFCEAPDVAS